MNTHISQQRLIQRGWTLGMIKDFLGRPDKRANNPHCPTPGRRLIKLFYLDRVREKEANPFVQMKIFETKIRRAKRKQKKQRLLQPQAAALSKGYNIAF